MRTILPYCASLKEKQTKGSQIARCVACALSVIVVLVGLLALAGVPGLHALGVVGGAAFVVTGSSMLIIGLCLQCVKPGKASQATPSLSDGNNPTPNEIMASGRARMNSVNQVKPEVLPINHGSLKEISENTMELMVQGFCHVSGEKKIYFKSGVELHNSSLVFHYDLELKSVSARYDQKISVLEKDSLEAAEELVRQGHKVAVVNFAGADSAGGGFLEGTGGQEEKLIYRCDLANLMKYYYDEQLKCDPNFKMYPLYDHLIHTPDVTVFRNSRFQILEEPFNVGILTSAAPVSKQFCAFADTAFEIIQKDDGEMDYAEEKTKDLMRRTIYTQLKAAYDLGYDAMVLGAFGCGAFQNPPDAVAKICHEVIHTYFEGAFKVIVFAILDGGRHKHNPKGNIEPFKFYFSSPS